MYKYLDAYNLPALCRVLLLSSMLTDELTPCCLGREVKRDAIRCGTFGTD